MLFHFSHETPPPTDYELREQIRVNFNIVYIFFRAEPLSSPETTISFYYLYSSTFEIIFGAILASSVFFSYILCRKFQHFVLMGWLHEF